MITVKSKNLREILHKFEYMDTFKAQPGLEALARQVQANARSKMAHISGEQKKETIIGSVDYNHVFVAVRVVYAAYQEEGQRRDGTHKIMNRTSPGQDHALKKATLEADLDVVVDWMNYELKSRLK